MTNLVVRAWCQALVDRLAETEPATLRRLARARGYQRRERLELDALFRTVLPEGTSRFDYPKAWDIATRFGKPAHQPNGLRLPLALVQVNNGERLLMRLLTQPAERVGQGLDPILDRLHDANLTLDWVQLAFDLHYWSHPSRWVQNAFHQAFVDAMNAPVPLE